MGVHTMKKLFLSATVLMLAALPARAFVVTNVVIDSVKLWNATTGTNMGVFASNTVSMYRTAHWSSFYLSGSQSSVNGGFGCDDYIQGNVNNKGMEKYWDGFDASFRNLDATKHTVVGQSNTFTFEAVNTGGPEGVSTNYLVQTLMLLMDTIGPKIGPLVAGDPVNVLSGNMFMQETDFSIPCPGLALTFERWYNGGQASTGSLGSGWQTIYDWKLSDLATDMSGYTLYWKQLRSGDGQSYFFRQIGTNICGTNVYMAPVDANMQLSMTASNYTVTMPGNMFMGFNTNGYLETISNLWGNCLTLSYSNSYPSNLLVKVEHNNGQQFTIGYNSSNWISWVQTTTNLSMSFLYDSCARLTNATRQVGPATEVTSYSAIDFLGNPNWMSRKQDAIGHNYNYNYDTNSRCTDVSIDNGAGLTFAVQCQSYKTNTGIPGGWAEQTDGRTVYYKRTATNSGPQTNQYWNYSFDPTLQRVTQILEPATNGVRAGMSCKYDTFNNVTNQLVWGLNSNGWYRMTALYDGWGNPTNVGFGYKSNPSNFWNATWNTNDLTLSSVTDPEGAKVSLEYTNSYLSRARLYYNTTSSYDTVFGYTTDGLLASVTNANGHGARFLYDGYGFPTSVIPPVGPVVNYAWNQYGDLQTVSRPSGDLDINDNPIMRVTTFRSDTKGQVTNVVFCHNATNYFENAFFMYNAIGDITNFVDTAGRSTRLSYLPTHKLASVSRTLTGATNAEITTSFEYDNQFNGLRVRDAKGRNVESYSLDFQDRVIAVTNLDGQSMSVRYTVGDCVDSITRFDATIVSNQYNPDGLLSRFTYPGGTNTFTYLRNGLLRTATNLSGIVSNTYDFANRLTATKSTAPSGTVNYTWFPAGQVSNVVSVAGTNTYELDLGDRLAAITATGRRATPLRFEFGYDTNYGLVSSIVSTSANISATLEYDYRDRLVGLYWSGTNFVRNFGCGYNSAGLVSGVTFETGDQVAYSYDSLDRLTEEKRTSPTGQTISDECYTYDEVGNRTVKTRDGITVNYSYSNGNNRLTGWSVPNTNLGAYVSVIGRSSDPIGVGLRYGQLWVSNKTAVVPEVVGTNFWVYDLPMNLGTQKVNVAIRDVAGNTTFASNTVRLSIVTNCTYKYSTAGCVTNITYKGSAYNRTLTLGWDGLYQLNEVRTNGVVAERSGFDALGRRAWMYDGSTTNYFVYSGSHLIAEVDSAGTLKKSYIYMGLDYPLAMTVYGTTTNTYCYIFDQQGSVHAIADNTGKLVESYRYDAWGRVLGVQDGSGNMLTQSAIGNRLLWQGREYNFRTGLYWHRTRAYDSISGRWLSPDRIGISGGLNLYEYCGSAPSAWRDPFGLCPASRYQSRMADLNSSQALFNRQYGPVMRFFGGFAFYLQRRGVTTTYNAELGGSSQRTAMFYGGTTVAGGSAFASGTAGLSGLAFVELSPLAIPVAIIAGSRGGTLDPAKVEEIRQAMIAGTYRFGSAEGQIAGWRNSTGQYMVSEGHHRMQAAIEAGPSYVQKLLQNGSWDKVQKFPMPALPLPGKGQ
ncbi:MAG: hypothetical protein C0404_07100 [Verrucomicrobia bacterium]|nr:hypothetical protein [Verrucomicrobiota bacterium]